MLAVGEAAAGLARARIVAREMDAHALPEPDASFDAVFCAFGARNLSDLEAATREQLRVLRPGGRLTVLEFFRPRGLFSRTFHACYNRTVLLVVGWAATGNLGRTFYLPRSIGAFVTIEDYERAARAGRPAGDRDASDCSAGWLGSSGPSGREVAHEVGRDRDWGERGDLRPPVAACPRGPVRRDMAERTCAQGPAGRLGGVGDGAAGVAYGARRADAAGDRGAGVRGPGGRAQDRPVPPAPPSAAAARRESGLLRANPPTEVFGSNVLARGAWAASLVRDADAAPRAGRRSRRRWSARSAAGSAGLPRPCSRPAATRPTRCW